jgi:hypothetical protein
MDMALQTYARLMPGARPVKTCENRRKPERFWIEQK